MHLPSLRMLVAVVGIGATGASCSITSDHFSCAMPVNGVLVRCTDYENVGVAFRPTVETLCRGFSGDFSTDKTCPTDKRIGGCKEIANGYTQTHWYYEGNSVAQTPAEVKGRCQGGEFFVDAQGMRPGDGGSSGGDDMSSPGDM